jgi:hypothetical protein
MNKMLILFTVTFLVTMPLSIKMTDASNDPHDLKFEMVNGWITYHGEVICGNGQHNGWWGGNRKCGSWMDEYKVRTSITLNDQGNCGPSHTEDLDKLTDAMLKFGYPAFEHNYGLWYDRRRDCHNIMRRCSEPVGPYYEQPWARSGTSGAWDGGNKYDLSKYNAWYFNRLNEMAGLCDAKGTILIHNYYLQHNLLESTSHYVDFPWRPVNCIQSTGMPDKIPAANVFYDISHTTRKDLHRTYIRKCLDELGKYENVVHQCGEEYTGDLTFMRFWLDTVIEWEEETGNRVIISLAAPKDVQDAILNDTTRSRYIDIIHIKYWWYKADGTLYAPKGGHEIPGRVFTGGDCANQSSPYQIYRQVKEYRQQYPDKAIFHTILASREQTAAFIMGGGSILIRRLQYADFAGGTNAWDPPSAYIKPENSQIILPIYNFIRTYLKNELQLLEIKSIVQINTDRNWCLGQTGKIYLVYMMNGGAVKLNLSEASGVDFDARWVDPENERILNANVRKVSGGEMVTFNAPDSSDWFLWLSNKMDHGLLRQ